MFELLFKAEKVQPLVVCGLFAEVELYAPETAFWSNPGSSGGFPAFIGTKCTFPVWGLRKHLPEADVYKGFGAGATKSRFLTKSAFWARNATQL